MGLHEGFPCIHGVDVSISSMSTETVATASEVLVARWVDVASFATVVILVESPE